MTPWFWLSMFLFAIVIIESVLVMFAMDRLLKELANLRARNLEATQRIREHLEELRKAR